MSKFNYIQGFWGMTIAASLILVGLVGSTAAGAVNSANRDSQISQETHRISTLKKQLDAVEKKYDDAKDQSAACLKAYGYAGQAYSTLRAAIVGNALTSDVVATINEYVEDATHAGCETQGTGTTS